MPALNQTLYRPQFEHDAGGVGLVARTTGQAGHDIVQLALQAIGRLKHHSGLDADGQSGDGAGLLTQLPHRLLAAEIDNLPSPGDYALGMLFLPNGEREGQALENAIKLVETTLSRLLPPPCQPTLTDRAGPAIANLPPPFTWRIVPINPEGLGPTARRTCPDIQQIIIPRPAHLEAGATFERFLFTARKQIEAAARQTGLTNFYVASLSSATVVYKGLMLSPYLADFYLDLANPLYETALATLHTRYSTGNTAHWQQAQPFRLIAHNGEINTVQGNINWMQARESTLASPFWPNGLDQLRPIIDPAGSDSAKLDNILELLLRAGRDLPHALSMLTPEAWENLSDLHPNRRAFYRYHAALIEPWDGPAAIVFCDGQRAGVLLDRNGLRPMRYLVTNANVVIATSETGVVTIDESAIVAKGKLGPGQMILVDLQQQRFLTNDQIKNELSHQRPYSEWVEGFKPLPTETRPAHFSLEPVISRPLPPKVNATPQWLARLQTASGYTSAEILTLIHPMAGEGQEPTTPRDDDPPPVGQSPQPRPLFHYFKQRFAQVTTPPLDPQRENLVMSLTIRLGARPNLLEETPKHAHLVELASPVLGDADLAALKGLGDPRFQTHTLAMRYPVARQAEGLHRTLKQLGKMAEDAIDQGKTILILSDLGINEHYAPIPSLLAVGAVHHHLVRRGKRMRASLVVESGEVREVHHLACLIGYGANAVNPYLALATVDDLVRSGKIRLAVTEARQNFVRALESGLLKVMSKIGISTADSYCGAQMFEVAGLESELVNEYFAGTASRPGDIGLVEIAGEVERWHQTGFYKIVPETLALDDNQAEARGEMAAPRPMLDLVTKGRPPLDLAEVESPEAILARFSPPALSPSPPGNVPLVVTLNPLEAKSSRGNQEWSDNRIQQIISSPPYHDVYSIEDLAQLIYDLKQFNPAAEVSVKLMAETGVGPIAAGVVKGGAEVVHITGHSGPSVSPRNKIRNVGLSWEIGLAETQQTLVMNGLRHRVRLRTEGGLQTGREVVIAAILGADEVSFSPTALIAGDNLLLPQANYSPPDPTLQARFAGTPEHFLASLYHIAEEVRQILARLGFRSLAEIIGRSELLRQISTGAPAAGTLDLSPLLAQTRIEGRETISPPATPPSLTPIRVGTLNQLLLEQSRPALDTGKPVQLTLPISNTDRTVGATLAGEIAKRYGDRGLPDGLINLTFLGSAGQSFGAFLTPGLNLTLIGEANDYAGKGISGGQIVLRPSLKSQLVTGEYVIMGNAGLYGATGGSLFVAGQAGERFAVRNSGAVAVVEGVGDHACEYMTGGMVVVLGRTGYNFGAGMSGGLAFVLDEEHHLTHRINPDMVQLVRVTNEQDVARLKHLITRHVRLTGSTHGQAILDDWHARLGLFWKVAPRGTVGSGAIWPASHQTLYNAESDRVNLLNPVQVNSPSNV